MINKYFVNRNLLKYTLKCFIGLIIGFLVCSLWKTDEVYWSMISIFLVISPEPQDSKKLAYERVLANLIGASAGIIAYWIHFPIYFKVASALLIIILICGLLDFLKVVRSAIVAMVIILLVNANSPSIYSGLERILFVTIGCMIGLLVTIVVEFIYDKYIE